MKLKKSKKYKKAVAGMEGLNPFSGSSSYWSEFISGGIIISTSVEVWDHWYRIQQQWIHKKKSGVLNLNLRKLKLLGIVIIGLTSCSEPEAASTLPGLDFGTATYHDSFIFSDSRNDTLSTRFKASFNTWAVENLAEATLIFTDREGNKVGQEGSGMTIMVNNDPVSDGTILIDSKRGYSDILLIQLHFEPSSSSRNFAGFIQMEEGTVERINNVSNLDENPQVLQWSAQQRVVMNPTLKALYWTAAVLLSSLFIWFLFFKNTIYPKMGSGRLTIQTPYYKSISTKGKRSVTLTASLKKQSFWSKLFTGSKDQEVNLIWGDEILFSPGRSRNNLRVKIPRGYSMDPYSTQIKRGQAYTLSKDALTIKFSYI